MSIEKKTIDVIVTTCDLCGHVANEIAAYPEPHMLHHIRYDKLPQWRPRGWAQRDLNGIVKDVCRTCTAHIRGTEIES